VSAEAAFGDQDAMLTIKDLIARYNYKFE
jgi:lysosomal acid lipase/cholesteryl ester hydrolase